MISENPSPPQIFIWVLHGTKTVRVSSLSSSKYPLRTACPQFCGIDRLGPAIFSDWRDRSVDWNPEQRLFDIRFQVQLFHWGFKYFFVKVASEIFVASSYSVANVSDKILIMNGLVCMKALQSNEIDLLGLHFGTRLKQNMAFLRPRSHRQYLDNSIH